MDEEDGWPEEIVHGRNALARELEQNVPDIKRAMQLASSLLKSLEDYRMRCDGEQLQKVHYAIDDLIDAHDCYAEKSEDEARVYLRDAVDCLSSL